MMKYNDKNKATRENASYAKLDDSLLDSVNGGIKQNADGSYEIVDEKKTVCPDGTTNWSFGCCKK